jgi:hypothetical protein
VFPNEGADALSSPGVVIRIAAVEGCALPDWIEAGA